MSACQIARFFKSLNVLGGRGLVLQSLGSLVAFQAMVSIATIGLYISYALPIFFRITIARKTFVPGPFNLGRYSLFIGWVAVAWVVVITVLFCLPVAYPVNKSSLNYTPVAVGGVFVLVLLYWALSARRWFKGPLVNLDESARDQKLAQL
jgi:amino acid transporter